MGDFINPPPTYIKEWNSHWRNWMRTFYDAAKSTEDDVSGAFSGNGFTTGDVKCALRGSAPTGWIRWNEQTIGNASSGATNRANEDCFDLFKQLYNTFTNTICPVSSGRGASADADWAANKTITLPPGTGRVIGSAGNAAGLTNRGEGVKYGAETHQLTESQMPSHEHKYYEGSGIGGNYPTFDKASQSGAGSDTETVGGDGSHSIMQPSVYYRWFIKL